MPEPTPHPLEIHPQHQPKNAADAAHLIRDEEMAEEETRRAIKNGLMKDGSEKEEERLRPALIIVMVSLEQMSG